MNKEKTKEAFEALETLESIAHMNLHGSMETSQFKCVDNEWRERKMTGSEKYHHSRVVESLQKEIAELKEKLAKTEWQQIETAPKDGTEVILSKWSGSYATPETSFCWAINGYFKDGYWYSKDPIIGKLAEPTHWMPLSQPPTKGD